MAAEGERYRSFDHSGAPNPEYCRKVQSLSRYPPGAPMWPADPSTITKELKDVWGECQQPKGF